MVRKSSIDSLKLDTAEERQVLWADVERHCTSFREFQPAYVLSLLRTPEYIRQEVQTLAAIVRESTFERRIARQSILTEPSRDFDFIMTEGALRWQVGSPKLMIEQILHLVHLSERPNIRLGLIPWDQPVEIFAGHAFHLYDDKAVGVGTAHSVLKVTEPQIVDIYRGLFEKLRRAARYGDEARNELARIMAAYATLDPSVSYRAANVEALNEEGGEAPPSK